MKRTASLLLALVATLVLQAQNLMVYRTAGKVTKVENGKSVPLNPKDIISATTTINVAYESMVELLDEKNAQRYTIKTPGEGTVQKLASAGGNGVKKLTAQYISYIKNQVSTNSKLVAARKYTDFAAVTRDSDSVQHSNLSPAMQRFMQHRDRVRDDYNAFRRRVNRDYNDFVRRVWATYNAKMPVEVPQERELEPIVYSIDIEEDKREPVISLVDPFSERLIPFVPLRLDPPQPLAEVKEVPAETLEERKYERMPFTFYGTDMAVRLDESKRINLGNISPKRIGDALDVLNSKDYDNVLFDCLKLRTDYHLCDWAYLSMLQEMCNQFCGEGTNEAVLLTGYLLSQSGYKMRYASAGGQLYLLVGSTYTIYNRCAYELDGMNYYPMDLTIPDQVHICPASMKSEKAIVLDVNPQPRFTLDKSDERTLTARNRPQFTVTSHVNKNLIDFYNSYPPFSLNNPFTRWAMYANVGMDENVRQHLYPQLQALLEGLSKQQAVAQILNWIQYSIPYEFDSKAWGGDRVFFAEETLYYPGSDCEDRAILFTRLVRDLLHLKCALVYYPGHLAAAVRMEEEVRGDCMVMNDESYLVCDPTYIGADPGMQMPSMDLDAAKLITLE